MNAVWNSYGQLCGCPEIFKKSCKFFCRELDIRVPQIMEPDPRQSRPLQHPVEHVEDAVRRDGAACGRWEHPGTAAHFLFLLLQNVHRVFRQRQGAVGVFRLERSLYDFAVDPGDLPFYPEVAPVQVNILPLQAQQLSPPKAGGQLHIVQSRRRRCPSPPAGRRSAAPLAVFSSPDVPASAGRTPRWDRW